MKLFKKRPSPAMIVAIAALVVSIGGTAVAGPIAEISLNRGEKKQIRKISRNISGKISRNISNRIFNRRAGQLVGPQGVPGIPGQQGEKGDEGDKGDTGPTFGRSDIGGLCNPNSGTFVDCATVDADLPTDGRVLLIGASAWDNDDQAAPNSGNCRLTVDGDPVGAGSVGLGESTTTHNLGRGGSVATTTVSENLSAGEHAFAFQCNQALGDVVFEDSTLSIVLLGEG